MSNPLFTQDPILVVVTETSWNAFSLHPEPTATDLLHMQRLVELGGVNESVAPGRYHFYTSDLNEETYAASLDPVEE